MPIMGHNGPMDPGAMTAGDMAGMPADGFAGATAGEMAAMPADHLSGCSHTQGPPCIMHVPNAHLPPVRMGTVV